MEHESRKSAGHKKAVNEKEYKKKGLKEMTQTAEIIAVGTELLLGSTANTDAQDVSRTLSELGINVYYQTVVGDNPKRLKEAVMIAKGRADIIITTGGLGPTFDDLTKQTLAETFGKELEYHAREAEKIREYFAERLHNMEMPENNMQQAYFPSGSEIFDNGEGTAPGCAFETEGKHVLMLPGPPGECRAMLKKCVVPYLKKLSDSEIRSHNIHIFGMGESAVESKLRKMMEGMENPTLAPYAKDSEVMLRLTAKARTREEADNLMKPVLETIRETLGDIIYGIDTESLENTVIGLLKEKQKSLSTAESCTGGLTSKRLTDIPGASEVYKGGVAAYSDESKRTLLAVEETLLAEKGAVSEEVAAAMAEGIRKLLRTDIGIGITGAAGPDKDPSGAEPGTVYVALSADGLNYCRALELYRDRERIRTSAASHALDLIRRYLSGLPL